MEPDVAATPPHDGAVYGPVDTMACPLVDPDGLINWIGSVVAPKHVAETRAESKRSFFMSVFQLLNRRDIYGRNR